VTTEQQPAEGRQVSATASDPQARIPRKRKKAPPKAARKAIRGDATARVWALRRKGLTFQEIEDTTAKQGDRIPRATAADLFKAELKRLADETRADVEAYKAEALAKLEAAQKGLGAKVAKGDHRAATAYARLQDQINKIRGVYAPIQVEDVSQRFRALSDEQMLAELQRGAQALGFAIVPAG
jgi:hypothetical protein